MGFDAVNVTNDIVEWIKEWFNENGSGCRAVIGISGGKDSSVTAALCVKALGTALGLPDIFVNKVPIDGLCGKTDEENLGFTYETLDKYIRSGVCDDDQSKARIDRMHKMSRFKLEPMPVFPYKP